ncbi:NUDIX hydrolase [Peredibacter sp. HCB2-198]|uniref:NUDIX hydrolase n=1 Tax=Peredibacter sp. HCB2-198 TaxID=3383025 RepID=UPI0038B62DF0
MKEAIMIVLEKDGKFLLGKRSAWKTKAPGYWCPISGHIEPNETEEEAVIREAQEELGIEVRPTQKITSTPTHDGRVMLHWWKAEIVKGNPQINNNENEEIRWFSKDELNTLRPTFKEDIAIFHSI